MAANISQIKTVTAQSFRLFVLTINRMLASTVFKKTKGTGSAYNKALKTTPFGCSDAFTRGGFAIMPHATAPLSLMLAFSRKFMTKGIKIKKVMSDGWTIVENFIPGISRHNEYYFDGKRAPAVRMTDKISAQYGAYTLIEKDLRSVIFWLSEIEKLKPEIEDRWKSPEKMNLIKGLFVAALTFYAKCFTSCEGRKLKLEKKMIDEEYHSIHDQVMSLRHNYAAHSGAENFEDVQISLALHPSKKSDMKPNLYSELLQPDYVTNEELAFKSLAESLQQKVLRKRNAVGETVLEKVVAPKGKLFWYKKAKKS